MISRSPTVRCALSVLLATTVLASCRDTPTTPDYRAMDLERSGTRPRVNISSDLPGDVTVQGCVSDQEEWNKDPSGDEPAPCPIGGIIVVAPPPPPPPPRRRMNRCRRPLRQVAVDPHHLPTVHAIFLSIGTLTVPGPIPTAHHRIRMNSQAIVPLIYSEKS